MTSLPFDTVGNILYLPQVLLLLFLGLAFTGPGKASLDQLIATRLRLR